MDRHVQGQVTPGVPLADQEVGWPPLRVLREVLLLRRDKTSEAADFEEDVPEESMSSADGA